MTCFPPLWAARIPTDFAGCQILLKFSRLAAFDEHCDRDGSQTHNKFQPSGQTIPASSELGGDLSSLQAPSGPWNEFTVLIIKHLAGKVREALKKLTIFLDFQQTNVKLHACEKLY